MEPVFTNNVVIFGILMLTLTGVFYTAHSENAFWKKFYLFVPPLLLCYFIPALLNWPFHLIAVEKDPPLYFVASRYLLPASLILLCLSIDFRSILRLGPKALIMFLTGTLGIIIGGPVALLFTIKFFPHLLSISPDELWRGLSTISGSWIGGGANQTAMKEIFGVDENLFGSMIVVDIIVANVWMAFLLYGASIAPRLDRWLKADTGAIDDLKSKVEAYRASIERIPSMLDNFILLGITFGGVAVAQALADVVVPLITPYEARLSEIGLSSLTSGFFWMIVFATTIGFAFSFTRFRALEGVGASKWGSVCIYILVATIGMQMNLEEVFSHLGLLMIGLIWMMTHAVLLLSVAKIIKAPFFFVAVGSQANVGGAASAPVVASAFSPSLAPVGVLLAVLGYAIGTYGAILCAELMHAVSQF